MLLYLVIIGQNKTKPNQTLSIWFFFLNSYFKVTYWQKNKIPQSQSISRTGTLLLTSEPGVSSWCCWNGSSIGKKHYLQAEVPFPGGSMATAPAARQVGFRSPKMAFSFQKVHLLSMTLTEFTEHFLICYREIRRFFGQDKNCDIVPLLIAH